MGTIRKLFHKVADKASSFVRTTTTALSKGLSAALTTPEVPRSGQLLAWTPAQPLSYRGYKHVSVPLTPVQVEALAKLTGADYMIEGSKITYNVGRNAAKRLCDSRGVNNKQRRRIRSMYRRILEQEVARAA